MKHFWLSIFPAVLFCLILSTVPASASGITALSVSNGSAVGHGNANDFGGWLFTTANAISVTALGEWNQGTFPTEPHFVGIYDSAGNQLVGEFVTGLNPAQGVGDQFTYDDLNTPFTLNAGQYFIGEFYPSYDPGGPFLYFTDPPTTAPGITYNGVGLYVGSAGPGNQNPNQFDGPNVLTQYEGNAFFGPDFQFNNVTAAPEPATLSLLGVGLAGLVGLLRKRA